MAKYDLLGIPYFNPMVDDWHPGMVPLEAQHLAEDEVIVFPVLGWSYAEGSLSELGFGPLKAMRQNRNRSFVYLIETELHERLTDPDRCKASLRARKLLLGHLKEIDAPNIYVVNSLDLALECTIELYKSHLNLYQLHEAAAKSMTG